MSDWQNSFASYTTGMAFHIALSHDQASLLAHLGFNKSHDGWQSRSGRGSFIPTFRGLKRRGLAEHNPAVSVVGWTTPNVRIKWYYRLTPAGEHVFYLLKFAGLAEIQPVAAESEAS